MNVTQLNRNSLGDLNDAALTIAERALDLDPKNQLAHSQVARQLVILGEQGDRARAPHQAAEANARRGLVMLIWAQVPFFNIAVTQTQRTDRRNRGRCARSLHFAK